MHVWSSPYPISLSKDSQNKMAMMEKDYELPFVPFVGLSIYYTDIFLGEVRRVSWLEDKSEFQCFLADNGNFVEGRKEASIEQIVEDYKKLGWRKA
jgi:hypothetical protein